MGVHQTPGTLWCLIRIAEQAGEVSRCHHLAHRSRRFPIPTPRAHLDTSGFPSPLPQRGQSPQDKEPTSFYRGLTISTLPQSIRLRFLVNVPTKSTRAGRKLGGPVSTRHCGLWAGRGKGAQAGTWGAPELPRLFSRAWPAATAGSIFRMGRNLVAAVSFCQMGPTHLPSTGRQGLSCFPLLPVWQGHGTSAMAPGY